MNRFPAPLDFLAHRRTLSWVLVPVLLLPIGMAILFLFSRVFALLQDPFSAAALNWAALVLCIFWCLLLILLLLCAVLVLLREEE